MRGLVGKKIGMTRIFDIDGNVVPVTILQAGPCTVTQLKTQGNDGYDAIQVGYGERKQKHVSKPLKGHFDKAGVEPKRILAEFEKVPGFDYQVGQSFHVGIFNEGDYVSVSGLSKGKGFTGVIKRHNFRPAKEDTWYWTYRKSTWVHWSSVRSISCVSWHEDGWSAW